MGCPTWFNDEGMIIECKGLKKWSKYDYYLKDFTWIQQESVFWRRSLWEKAGSSLAVSLNYAGDLELWLRFFRFEKLYVTPLVWWFPYSF